MSRILFLMFGIVLMPFSAFPQDVDVQLAAIQKALSEEDFDLAQSLFEKETDKYLANQDFLNLSYFIPFAGRVAGARNGDARGMEAVQYWLDLIRKESKDPRDLRQAYLEAHSYYKEAGKLAMAYEANETALDYTYQIPDHRPEEWALIESNLGVIANQMGNPEKARSHTLKAKEGYEQDPKTSPVNYFNLLNDLGARYWFAAKWDSAEYYWLEGMDYLDKMEPTPTNQYYRRSMIEGNLAAVYDVKGEVQESINRVKSSIMNTQYFIDNALDDPKRGNAFQFLFHGSMNLALVYKSLGNYQEALRLQEHTLKAKEAYFPAGHPEITESLIQVGQTHRFLDNFVKAKQFLEKALREIQKADGDFFMQLADIHYTLALIYESQAQVLLAKKHYLLAKEYFEQAYQERFDFVYLDFLGNAATFFSTNNDAEFALNWAKQGLDYITRVNGRHSMPGFLQTLNMGRVHYNLGDFQNALTYAGESLSILENRIQQSDTGIDSIRTNFDKPQAILLYEQSNYALTETKTIAFLENSLDRLLEAMTILDERKNFLSETEDLTILVAENLELIDFVKKIQLELFDKTGDEKYLDGLIAVQESSVYTLIRTQINRQKGIRFANLPKELQEQESMIRQRLNGLLDEGGDLNAYHQLSNEWEAFLTKLRQDHPDYFKMRYASIDPEKIAIPQDRQIVRYFFVADQLKAVLFADGKRKMFHLDFDKDLIADLETNWEYPEKLSEITAALYAQLWEPFAAELKQERVLIIPSGVLFNLNFEILTNRPLTEYKDFSTHSLLAQHDLSYHYSLWLLNVKKQENIPGSYIAFAPGFLDTMKEKYLSSIQGDSLRLDQTYLSLLPQPFTVDLAQKTASLFDGETFVHEQSTPEVFRTQAGNHKIIHIATHAESNNVSPAFSRLIFAKSDKPEEDNAIYAHEIYNTDLKANLTVLTACETGKPVYKPGEGMISLAHAFQYSGSESLLTSLWRIDEKSSMKITDFFYTFLSSGMAKDKALKQAKLKYIAQNDGRILSPQYWAGLVLIGNPDPITGLENKENRIFWLLGAGFVFAVTFLFFFKKKKHSR